MWSDPIVEEVRKLRLQYVKQFKHDFSSIFADLRKKEQLRTQQGWKIVELPPQSGVKKVVTNANK